MMNYDEKILELQKRIEVLEKAENKRIAKRKREIAFEIGKFLLIIMILVIGYCYIYNTFVKPYKDKVDYVEEKIDSVENFVDEKLDIISKYNPFN